MLIKTIRGVGYQFCRTPEDAQRGMRLALRQDPALVLVHAGDHGRRIGVHLRVQHEPGRYRQQSPGVAAGSASNWKRPASPMKTAAGPALQAFLDNLHTHLRRARRAHRRERPRPAHRRRPLRPDPHARAALLVRHSARCGSDPPSSRAAGRRQVLVLLHRAAGAASAPGSCTPDTCSSCGAAILLCYWLAFHLTSPVRTLQKAVERFGRGDLSARVGVRPPRRTRPAGAHVRPHGRTASKPCWPPNAACCWTSRTSCARRWRGWASPSNWRARATTCDAALNRIQKESDRLNSLVGQLLQVTRAEGDPSSLRHNPVRLDELVQQLVDDSAIEAAARGCDLRYDKREPVVGGGRSRTAAPRRGERDSQRHPLLAPRSAGGSFGRQE